MKSVTLALTLAATILSSSVEAKRSPSILANFESAAFNQTNMNNAMSEFRFFSKLTYTTYNGVIRGLYREHAHTVVSENCLGEWVTRNLTYLEMVWQKIYDFEVLSIPYEDALEAAKDVVNLIYRNRDACEIDRVIADFESFCGEDQCLEDLNVIENIKTHLFAIAGKIEPVLEYLLSNMDSNSDDDVLKMADTFGEAYGSVVSYILGFDKRFILPKAKALF